MLDDVIVILHVLYMPSNTYSLSFPSFLFFPFQSMHENMPDVAAMRREMAEMRAAMEK
jgi:hypothetical protein